MPNRTTAERIAHARQRLETDSTVWIATASGDGVPHLVPLTLAWVDERIVVSTPTANPTARNASVSGLARAALDGTEDVVMVDADVVVVAFAAADPALIDSYVARAGWDPREQPGDWSLLSLMPRRIEVWNSTAEIAGRTVMRDGQWLAD